jgi:hypothetical protein
MRIKKLVKKNPNAAAPGFLGQAKSFKNRLQIAFYVVCLRGLFKCFAPVWDCPLAPTARGRNCSRLSLLGSSTIWQKKPSKGKAS